MSVRYRDQLDLAAVATAVSCSRMFARLTLAKWGAVDVLDEVLVVVSELVTNAVRATGIAEPQLNWGELTSLSLLTVRLIGLEASVVIEVWDASGKKPTLSRATPDDEGGRGLAIVEHLAARWGTRPHHHGGKVVWAELPVLSWHPPRPPERRCRASSSVGGDGLAAEWLRPDEHVLTAVLKGLEEL